MRKNVEVFGRGTEGEKRKKAGLRRPAPPCHRSPERGDKEKRKKKTDGGGRSWVFRVRRRRESIFFY